MRILSLLLALIAGQAPYSGVHAAAPPSGQASGSAGSRAADEVNLLDFGANPNDDQDDSAAIQAAVDYITGSADPAKNTRVAQKCLYAPGGTVGYVVSVPIRISSVQGFCLRGDGYEATRFLGAGAAMPAVFDLDGTAYSTFRHFAIGTTSGPGTTGAAKYGLWLHWSGPGVTRRSSTHNTFDGIWAWGRFKAAFKVGHDGTTSNQVDQTVWIECRADGNWTPGETTWWQSGFEFGMGQYGNILIHSVFHIASNHWRRGVTIDATNVSIYGGIIQSNETDLYVNATNYVHVSGIRSEGSRRLLETSGPATFPANFSLVDILWRNEVLHPDGHVIIHKLPGTLYLRNVAFTGVNKDNMRVQAYGNPGPPARLTLSVEGITAQMSSSAACDRFFDLPNSTVTLVSQGFSCAPGGTVAPHSSDFGIALIGEDPRLQFGGRGVAPDSTIRRNAQYFDIDSTAANGLRIATHPTHRLGFYGAPPVPRPPKSTDLKAALGAVGLVETGGATPLDLQGGRLTAGGIQHAEAGGRPDCTSATRGLVWFVRGTAGVADTINLCAKNSADGYGWRPL